MHETKIHLMKSFAISLVLLFAPLSFAQTAPDMASAPYFEQVLKNDSVRVFRVTLGQGQQVVVSHSYNYLMVTLQDCEIVLWPEGKSDVTSFRLSYGDTRFVFGGSASGMRNEQTQIFRALFVEFLDPKVTTFAYQASGSWDYGASIVRVPLDPHAKFSNGLGLQAATVTDVQLLSGDSLDAPDKQKPTLLIPLSDLELSAGKLKINNSSGEVTWIPLGRKSPWENEAREPARFVLVEFAQ
jgi:hypothetical protein